MQSVKSEIATIFLVSFLHFLSGNALHLNARHTERSKWMITPKYQSYVPDLTAGGTKLCSPTWSTYAGAWSGGGCYSILSQLGLMKSINYNAYSGFEKETFPMSITACVSGGCWAIGLVINYFWAKALPATYTAAYLQTYITPTYKQRMMGSVCESNTQSWIGQCQLGQYCMDRIFVGGCDGKDNWLSGLKKYGCTYNIKVESKIVSDKYAKLYQDSDLQGGSTCFTTAGCSEELSLSLRYNLFGDISSCTKGAEFPQQRSLYSSLINAGKENMKTNIEYLFQLSTATSIVQFIDLLRTMQNAFSPYTGVQGLLQELIYQMFFAFHLEKKYTYVPTEDVLGAWNTMIKYYVYALNDNVNYINTWAYETYVVDASQNITDPNMYSWYGNKGSCDYKVGFLRGEVTLVGAAVVSLLPSGTREGWLKTVSTSGNTVPLALDLQFQMQVLANCLLYTFYLQVETSKGHYPTPYGYFFDQFTDRMFLMRSKFMQQHAKELRESKNFLQLDSSYNHSSTSQPSPAYVLSSLLQGTESWWTQGLSTLPLYTDKIETQASDLLSIKADDSKTTSLGVSKVYGDGTLVDVNGVGYAVFLMEITPEAERPKNLALFMVGGGTNSDVLNIKTAMQHFIPISSYGETFLGGLQAQYTWAIPLQNPLFNMCPAGRLKVKNKNYVMSVDATLYQIVYDVGVSCTSEIITSFTESATCKNLAFHASKTSLFFIPDAKVLRNVYWSLKGRWPVNPNVIATLMNENEQAAIWVNKMYSDAINLKTRYTEYFPWSKHGIAHAMGGSDPTDAYAIMSYSSYRGYMLNCALQAMLRKGFAAQNGGWTEMRLDPGYFQDWVLATSMQFHEGSTEEKAKFIGNMDIVPIEDTETATRNEQYYLDTPENLETISTTKPGSDILPDTCMMCATSFDSCKGFFAVVGINHDHNLGNMILRGAYHKNQCPAYKNTGANGASDRVVEPLASSVQYDGSKSYGNLQSYAVNSSSASPTTAGAECGMAELQVCHPYVIGAELRWLMTNGLATGSPWLSVGFYTSTEGNSLGFEKCVPDDNDSQDQKDLCDGKMSEDLMSKLDDGDIRWKWEGFERIRYLSYKMMIPFSDFYGYDAPFKSGEVQGYDMSVACCEPGSMDVAAVGIGTSKHTYDMGDKTVSMYYLSASRPLDKPMGKKMTKGFSICASVGGWQCSVGDIRALWQYQVCLGTVSAYKYVYSVYYTKQGVRVWDETFMSSNDARGPLWAPYWDSNSKPSEQGAKTAINNPGMFNNKDPAKLLEKKLTPFETSALIALQNGIKYKPYPVTDVGPQDVDCYTGCSCGTQKCNNACCFEEPQLCTGLPYCSADAEAKAKADAAGAGSGSGGGSGSGAVSFMQQDEYSDAGSDEPFLLREKKAANYVIGISYVRAKDNPWTESDHAISSSNDMVAFIYCCHKLPKDKYAYCAQAYSPSTQNSWPNKICTATGKGASFNCVAETETIGNEITDVVEGAMR